MSTEPLVLSNEMLRVEVLPQFGAKISSLTLLPSGEELLQQPLLPYAPRSRTMAFEEGDASGIDECIPSVSGCEITLGGRKLEVPDHGDFWRIPFAVNWEGNDLALTADGYTLPLRFTKRLQLSGNSFKLSYSLENLGSVPVPFLWSAHPGFAVEAGDRILLPPSVSTVEVWYSGNARLGRAGRVHPWPHTRDSSGQSVDLSVAGGAHDGVGDKVFAAAPGEGWAALHRRRLDMKIEIHFDPKQSTSLGLWLAYGGWPPQGVQRQHCVALEPCTAAADSLAAALERGSALTLPPSDRYEWTIEIRVVPA